MNWILIILYCSIGKLILIVYLLFINKTFDDQNNENANQLNFANKKVETIILSGLPHDDLQYQATTKILFME